MAQYLAIKGDKTRLRPGDIPIVREDKGLDGCRVSIERDGEKLSFEAVGGPYGLTEYFFPCSAVIAEEIVSAIKEGRDYLGMIYPFPADLLVQAQCFYGIANGLSVV